MVNQIFEAISDLFAKKINAKNGWSVSLILLFCVFLSVLLIDRLLIGAVTINRIKKFFKRQLQPQRFVMTIK